MFKKVDQFEEEVKWTKELVETHPVLASLPEEIRRELVVEPGPWNGLPVNRRRRT